MASVTTMTVGDREDEFVCPYDESHKIRSKRMPMHLMKCRKAHPSLSRKFAKCPFNACHEVIEVEYRFHLSQCPDRAMINNKISEEIANEEKCTGYVGIPEYVPCDIPGESWECDESRHAQFSDVVHHQLVSRGDASSHSAPVIELSKLSLDDIDTTDMSARMKRALYFKWRSMRLEHEGEGQNTKAMARCPQTDSESLCQNDVAQRNRYKNIYFSGCGRGSGVYKC